MTFSSLIRSLEKSPLTQELVSKLEQKRLLGLNGIPRLPKSLVSSSMAKIKGENLLVICATIEEGGRWAAQLETMGWQAVHFYPTSEASPYDPFDPESETIWGQMQVLSALIDATLNPPQTEDGELKLAIVATWTALQPHLPPKSVFQEYCLSLTAGTNLDSKNFDRELTKLGYQRVPLVETEGQWSRRGDIVDIFPVSSEIPIRLEWYGDELEKLREFDPATQRSLEAISNLVLTPTNFSHIITNAIDSPEELLAEYLASEEIDKLKAGNCLDGMRRFLGAAFNPTASILDYLPKNTLCAIDEVEQCRAHCDRAFIYDRERWELIVHDKSYYLPPIHNNFAESLTSLQTKFSCLYLCELSTEATENHIPTIDLSCRPLPINPHQFSKLAQMLRGKREIYDNINLNKYATWLISAQPSRSVSLLQEHDCQAQFVPNARDYPAIQKLIERNTAIALKYSGFAELEGFILPTYRIVVVTDREFFGQHSLATSGYIRKRRRAASKQVDLNRLHPGDYVVHKHHGIGKFIGLESLATREYIAIQYADGLLRVPADNLDSVSRFRNGSDRPPALDRMSSKSWEKTKSQVRKSIKKLAVDLVQLYAKRTQLVGYAYPPDTPWQQELEDSFPYQPTADQLKAFQDIKRDLESERPMDRLVCGDVGFGKTEVAIRAIFKAITCGNKQVAFLAPTTILTQQHYHTLKERFSPYPIEVGLLNRFRSISERKEIIQRLATGELDVVIGTHQLLSKDIRFRELGLLVIDEEQRFGVNQKEKIKSLKTQLDVLTLTATPIPRTLYMSMSGIREMSLISTPPPSRRPIKSHLSPYNPEVVRSAIRNELDRGGQVFYVVPRVEGIEEVAAQIKQMIPSARIEIAHGQMAESDLEATMLTFNNGEADILVCTTIIESGLDIPRVNTIIIEDAQKFGLSQLYQLRGRVGRAGIQAHAWLLYPSKHTLTDDAKKRLRALQELSQLGSGYQLATRDMEIRGVGNLLGVEQSGLTMAIGFDLYMEMLQEAIKEIQGQEIPQVEDTQIDLNLTAFIPADYINDIEQKMNAYRMAACASSKTELNQIAIEWRDRYGNLPSPVEQLLQAIELKQIAKSLGFSRVKSDGKQHVLLETPMAEPAWKLMTEKLPVHLRSRFVWTPKKVTVRGLGMLKPQKQLESLIEWLGTIRDGFDSIS